MDIIDVMAREEKICNYLDMPLQHASDPMLKAMKRQITQKDQIELIEAIRAKLPGIAIRTTMLVGFPGETEEDFQELCDYVRRMKFERLGVFTYSHEEDTSAYALEDNISEELKLERSNALMEIQEEISFEKNLEKVGKRFKVLVDRKEGDYFIGRTEYDSPEVDNEVLIDAREFFARVGDFVEVEIINAEAYDLYGKIV